MTRFPISALPTVVASVPYADRPRRKIRMSEATFQANLDVAHDDGRPVMTPTGKPKPSVPSIRTVEADVPLGYFDIVEVSA